MATIISVSVSQATWNFSIASIRSRKSGFLNCVHNDRMNSCDCGSKRGIAVEFCCVLLKEDDMGGGCCCGGCGGRVGSK